MTFEEKINYYLKLYGFNKNEILTIDKINKKYKILAKKYHPDTSIYKDGNEFIKFIEGKKFLLRNIDYINNNGFNDNYTKDELYEEAIKSFNNDLYEKAISIFEMLDEYKDSIDLLNESRVILESLNKKKYDDAKLYFNDKRYIKSYKIFNKILGYKDSFEYVTKIKKKLNMFYSLLLIFIGLIVILLLIFTLILVL